jgi:hypothetical protein
MIDRMMGARIWSRWFRIARSERLQMAGRDLPRLLLIRSREKEFLVRERRVKAPEEEDLSGGNVGEAVERGSWMILGRTL